MKTWGARLVAVVKSRPLTLFFTLTFCFSWIFWVPSAILFAGGGVEGGTIFDALGSPLFVLLQTLGAAGPSLMAILVVRLLYGRERLYRLLGRFKMWRVGKRWYLVSVLLIPLITVLSVGVHALFTWAQGLPFALPPDSNLGAVVGEIGVSGLVLSLPVIFVSQLFSSPLLEELGWRGLALSMLQDRLNALVSSLLLGLIWGMWHLPLILAYGDYLPTYLALITAHTILMTWVINSTGGTC